MPKFKVSTTLGLCEFYGEHDPSRRWPFNDYAHFSRNGAVNKQYSQNPLLVQVQPLHNQHAIGLDLGRKDYWTVERYWDMITEYFVPIQTGNWFQQDGATAHKLYYVICFSVA